RLSTADSKSPGHDLEPNTVFAKFLGRSYNGHGKAVLQGPGVGVMAVKTPKHTAGRPGHDANSRTVERRAGGERMKESHVPARERRPRLRVGNVLAEILAKHERAFSL